MTASAAPLLPSPAWARVRILLNLGRIEEAAAAASEAARHTVWSDEAMSIGGPDVHGLVDLPVGWCFLDPEANLAVINDTVVDDFCGNLCLFRFVYIGTTLSAPAFRWYDVDNWTILRDMDGGSPAEVLE